MRPRHLVAVALITTLAAACSIRGAQSARTPDGLPWNPSLPAGGFWTGTIALTRLPRVAELVSPQVFTGEIEVQGVVTLGMSLIVDRTPAGRPLLYLDVPMQMVQGLPLADVVTWIRERTGLEEASR